jgi:predicted NodU family carbamoyl transferase
MQRRDGLRHLLWPRILLARPASIRGRGACERDTSSLANNICRIAERAREGCDTNNLVIAGGVGLNSFANWRIQQKGIFDNVWIQPAAGDDGGALGAAR